MESVMGMMCPLVPPAVQCRMEMCPYLPPVGECGEVHVIIGPSCWEYREAMCPLASSLKVPILSLAPSTSRDCWKL